MLGFGLWGFKVQIQHFRVLGLVSWSPLFSERPSDSQSPGGHDLLSSQPPLVTRKCQNSDRNC